jgi:hypothetical protein
MVCDPSSGVKQVDERNNLMISQTTYSNNNVEPIGGGKRWSVEALYESCRLKVSMTTNGQVMSMF